MVSTQIKSESRYEAAFRELVNEPSPGATWFDQLRESAMDRFEALGLPSVEHEEWKYTNLAALAKVDFDPAIFPSQSLSAPDLIQTFNYPESSKSQLVLLNGLFQRELSSLEGLSEIVAMELSKAVTDDRYGDLVRRYLATSADYNNSGPTALNTALIASGLFILIPRNTKLGVPLHILSLTDPVESDEAVFPRVLVISEENSSATIIETYASTRDAQYFTNSVVEVVLMDGARLEHYRVQHESTKAFHIATTAADLAANSSYDATAINLGGHLARHNVSVVMNSEGAECWVDGLYTVGPGQHTDTHSSIDHQQPHCTSHQLYKGILDGNSRAVFNGKIFVRHGAQKTDALQTNKNLLLSPEARVDTKPQLEIFADDVKCAHGAAVGQIEEEELFYLQTRGIHPDLGRNLLTYGFAEEVIGKIKIESIRAQLDEVVLNRLNTRLEA